jgi:hypothetical protein
MLPNAGIDLYYLGLRRDIGPFNEGVARETRHTLGTRIHGSFDSFDYDVEGGGQFGTFAVAGSGSDRRWVTFPNCLRTVTILELVGDRVAKVTAKVAALKRGLRQHHVFENWTARKKAKTRSDSGGCHESRGV